VCAVKRIATVAEYERVFELECQNEYPLIDAFEERIGFKIEKSVLEFTARVLACPVKVNPPNWQHGRVVYALARERLARCAEDEVPVFVDIGTAKGFSALMMALAFTDADQTCGRIHSVDAIDPDDRVIRNSCVEATDGPQPLSFYLDTVAAQNELRFIEFYGGGFARLAREPLPRVAFAFVDGKHSFEAVREEARWLSQRQGVGDVIVFDDAQIDGVWAGIKTLSADYHQDLMSVRSGRRYVVARRIK
jgi:hypothetical protein